MIALIDGDLLIYRAAFKAEQAVAWDADTFAIQANLRVAKEEFDNLVHGIQHVTESRTAKVAISCPTEENFRRDVWPDYKAPRADPGRRSAKPILYRAMRQHVRESYSCVERPRLEADDVLGIMATMHSDVPRVICSIDKDMLSIPGLHYDWRTPHIGVFDISKLEARRAFYTQVLTGDTTDNYPGLPRVGPKKAAAILEGCITPGEFWAAVVGAYEGKGLTEHDAIVQARCARILRAIDYDFDTKQPRLWTPLRGE